MRRLLAALTVVGLVSGMLASLLPDPMTSAAPPPGVIPGQYIVVLKRGVDPAIKAKKVAVEHSARVKHVYDRVLNGFSATIPAARLAKLQADPDVLLISEDREVYATDTVPTGIARIQATENPQVLSGAAASSRVAVLDTGIDPGHPDLNVGAGKACVTGDATTRDVYGHGTHVAGTIGAKSNGSGVVGVAPGAQVVPVKVLSDSGSGSFSDIICGLDWVAASGIKVANMSLSGGGSDDGNCGNSNNDALHRAVCSAVNTYGVTIAVAAGNSGVNASGSVPAAYDEVITVSALADSNGKPCGGGAATSAGGDDTMATFSNYGLDVDIAAPGVDILSTTVGGGTGLKSGTSMASPHVAGSAALYLLANPGASPAQVRSGLIGEWRAGPISGDKDNSDTNPSTFVESDEEGIVNVRWTTAGGVPVVAIETINNLSPDSGGQTVSGSVKVAFSAVDKDPWCRLYYSPGKVALTAKPTAGGSDLVLTGVAYNGATDRFEATWDTTKAPNGDYSLTAAATDRKYTPATGGFTVSAGNTGTASTPVTVRNAQAAPTVAITTPKAGASVRGTVPLEATASDTDGTVSSVAFAYTTSPSGTSSVWTAIGTSDPSAPYQAAWDTTAKDGAGKPVVPDGAYDLRAVATDNSGLTSTSVVTVTVDNTAPTVTAMVPADTARDIPVTANVTATFSEAMTAATVTSTTFTLVGGSGAAVPSTVTYDAASKTATLDPTADLAPNTTYTARVTTGVTDTAGNTLAADQVWSFTTGAADTTPPVVSAAPVGGTYSTAQSVTLASNEPAAIYYTTDGSSPTTASTTYAAPVAVGEGTTVLTYTAVDRAGNRAPDAQQTYVVDSTAPAAPTGLNSLVSATSVTLTWTAATDTTGGSGLAGYDVFRDGVRLGPGDAPTTTTTYADPVTVANGVRARYEVKARDAAGNVSPPSNAVVALGDGFETGLGLWTNSGLVTSGVTGYAGAGVQAKTTSSGKYARATLGLKQPGLYYRARFNVVSQGSKTFAILKVRYGATTCGSPLLTITVDGKGKLGYRNDLTGTSTTTSTVVGKGTWHEVQVRVQTAGTASILQIWYHGTKIVDTTTALGTTEAGCVQIGEDGSGRSYDVRFDDVAVGTAMIPYAGPAAGAVTAAGADATSTPSATPSPSPSPTPSPTASPTPTPVPNTKPVADAGPDQGITDADLDGGEVVTLDGSASYDGDGTVVGYEWQTADGQIIAGDAVAQVWLPVGRHTLRLVVTDDRGGRDADKVVVEVQPGNATPVADAGPDPDVTTTDADGDGSEPVTLDASASFDPDGAALSYAWSINGQVIATDPVVTVAILVGRSEVTLTVTDDAGATAVDTMVVTVDAAPTPEPTATEAAPAAADVPPTNEETPTP